VTARRPARDPLAPGDVNQAGQFVLGRAQPETGITQCQWVDPDSTRTNDTLRREATAKKDANRSRRRHYLALGAGTDPS
jgi:hypothetical protein